MWQVLFMFCIIGGVFGQSPGLGACPDVKTVSSIDLSRYAGRWYEAMRFFTVFELTGKCVTADYTLIDSNGTVNVVNSQISTLTNKRSSIEGTAEIVDLAEPGKLKVTFPSVPIKNSGSYWVLGTDYDSYAAVWSCTSLKIANLQFGWILTREKNPPESVIQKATNVFKLNDLKPSKFYKTNQLDCPDDK
ncbi:hypothetical protein HCN44_000104 [Aphidius gifuensis]|uniref:Apolipoprotein D n=1 Tax=Aphidius gifuensis TaxID=684658 RepID=A0A835CMZ5_APHGI|nr:apolipoprotein D-like [Aphidius gifuensis]KAF7990299.1 hypothetical protein HCN44_000104 [Aphidius gifuensis]